jgi:hypothetical protein
MKGDLTMSGGYSANAGGIFVSGSTAGTPNDVDRRIHLMIYQLASYVNTKEVGASIQQAAERVLGGAPHPGEIQATPLTAPSPAGYFATDIRLNNGIDVALAVGISPDVTYYPQNDPNLYYVLDLQDLSLITTVLQLLDRVSNQQASEAVFKATLSGLKRVSDQLEDRAEHQGWAGRSTS